VSKDIDKFEKSFKMKGEKGGLHVQENE